MRAGEAWWIGRDEAYANARDKARPKVYSRAAEYAINVSRVKDATSRDGTAYKREVLDHYVHTVGVHDKQWGIGMDIETAATESTDRAIASVDKLNATVKSFREQIKNDMASMKAASERVQSEVAQMEAKYRAASALLTSPDFERAIDNAERLAVALEAISKLSETKLSVAVFGSAPKAEKS